MYCAHLRDAMGGQDRFELSHTKVHIPVEYVFSVQACPTFGNYARQNKLPPVLKDGLVHGRIKQEKSILLDIFFDFFLPLPIFTKLA